EPLVILTRRYADSDRDDPLKGMGHEARRLKVAPQRPPQTGPLKNHGMHAPGPRSVHKVSSATVPRPSSQRVPVTTFLPGTGHDRQPKRLAMRGPRLASISGHAMRPSTTAVGITIEVTSAGPSFRS